MSGERRASRRTALRLFAVSASVGGVSGCLSGSEEDLPGERIDPGSKILFEGHHENWIGVLPNEIADKENPTIVLEAGEQYELGWVQGDGGVHNIEIRNDEDEVVGGLATDLVVTPGTDGDWLEFSATEEMAYYRCEPHRLMEGEIHVID